jgi:hypothetical protein
MCHPVNEKKPPRQREEERKKYGVKVLTALAVGLDAAQVIYNSPPFTIQSLSWLFSVANCAPLLRRVVVVVCIFKQP